MKDKKTYYIKNKSDLIFWFIVIGFIVGIIDSITDFLTITSQTGFTLFLIFIIILFIKVGVKNE